MRRKSILIADDDGPLVEALAIRCRQLGLDVRTALDAEAAVIAINVSQPDLVCLDVNMPGRNGLSVAKVLSSMPGWRSIPIIILTGREDPDTIKRCHDMCAYYVLKCHTIWPRMEPLIRELLDIDHEELVSADDCHSAVTVVNKDSIRLARPIERRAADSTSGSAVVADSLSSSSETIPFCRVDEPVALVVEDELSVVNTIRLFLSHTQLKVLHTDDFDETIRLAGDADVILCDVNLPTFRGTFIAQELRSRGCRTPIIMISADGGEHNTLETANAGIRSFLVKPFSKSQLLETLGREVALDSCQNV